MLEPICGQRLRSAVLLLSDSLGLVIREA